MRQAIWVGLGGFVGAIMRYLVSGWAQQASHAAKFPYGTLAVNVIGCLVLGMLTEIPEGRGVFSPEARLLVLVGMLGAFTTLSTLGNETLSLAREGASLMALGNVAANLLLAPGMVWLGHALGARIWS